MSESHVISALRAKRAEVDGEIRQAENRVGRLRKQLEAIDGAIGVFDPSIVPHSIRPKSKPPPAAHFKRGQFSRAVLDTLRKAGEPMTPRTLGERTAAEYHLDTSMAGALKMSVQRVRNVLANHKLDLNRAQHCETTLWSA